MKDFMYGCIAAMCIVFTICACIITHSHTSKARVTCNVRDDISISAYVNKSDVEGIGDVYELSVKGLKNGNQKCR